MKISLTQFVDVVACSGLRKFGKVQVVRQQLEDAYSPGKDMYKGLRDGIVALHRQGREAIYLDQVLFGTRDERRKRLYSERILSYKKWLGRKKLSWVEPKSAVYEGHGVDVRVNPELGFELAGKTCIVKLYFKAEKLDTQAARLIGALMSASLSESYPDATFAVLDVKQGKLREFGGVVDERLLSVIDAELLYLGRLFEGKAA